MNMNMRRTLVCLAALTFGLAPNFALAGNYPPITYNNSPIDTIQSFGNSFAQQVNTNSTGLLYSLFAPVTATAAATTQTLGSYTLPASYLTNIGQSLRIKVTYTTAANANSKTPVLTFGTFTLTGTALTGAGAQSARYECLVTKTGASTQNIVCEGLSVVTPVAVTQTNGTSTDTAGIVINGQCTQGSASADCTLANMTVESLR